MTVPTQHNPWSPVHPSGDARFLQLEHELERHQFQQHALIEILHSAQNIFGSLSLDLLHFVAHHMKLPPSRVFGVATFYHFFTLTAKATHEFVVCLGTACFIKGGDQLLAAAQSTAHGLAGETTADRRLSLQTARCIGACGIAPLVVCDGVVLGNQSVANVRNCIGEWLADATS